MPKTSEELYHLSQHARIKKNDLVFQKRVKRRNKEARFYARN